MLRIALALLLLAMATPAMAFPASIVGGVGGTTAWPLPNGNVAPPTGQSWYVTLDDEFNQDSRLSISLWNAGHGAPPGLTWPLCNGNGSDGSVDSNHYVDQLGWQIENACNQEFGIFGTAPYVGIEPGIGLYVQPLIDYTIPADQTLSNSWDTTQSWMGVQNYGHFSQIYGYFEVRAKYPHDTAGEGDGLHPDIWMAINSRVTNCCSDEIDFGEQDLGSATADFVHCTVNQVTSPALYDLDIPTTSVGDLSQAFHTYAVYWRNTGSGYGTVQCYFDGVPQGSPSPTLTDSGWGSGMYILPGWMQQILTPAWGGGAVPTAVTSNNNPLIIQYVRAWQSH